MSEPRTSETDRARARVTRSRWPGWIWAVPIAALMIVAWLGFRALASGGEDITIRFDNAHDLKEKNTDVVYRGTKVGSVTSVALSDDGKGVDVAATIDKNAAKLLTIGTRFWLRGASPSVSNLSSLGAVLSGPTVVMEPGPGDHTTHFSGLARQPIAPAGDNQGQTYLVSFDGAVGSLKVGDPVTLRDFTVGEVKSLGFAFDAKTGRLSTPVTVALYPALFHIENGAGAAPGAALSRAVATLIGQGMRARLDREPPLIGAVRVTLDFVPDATGANAPSASDPPQIPTAPGGGIDSIVTRLDKVPLDDIANQVLEITKRVDGLVGSPKLTDAIAQLDAALAQIRQLAATSGPKLDELTDTLRKTANQLDETVRSANKAIGSTTSQNGLTTAMREVTDAARSIRDLAGYLDQHPEAVIRGRNGAQ